MFKYNNNHIFTGYLKQLLSTVNIPACKIYTRDFSSYKERYGKEDPRVIESFDSITYGPLTPDTAAARINYLKDNELYQYFWDKPLTSESTKYWKRTTDVFYDANKTTYGLTRTLQSKGAIYDTTTHEYLGDYLRFLRDYYNINLMSMYNCFNYKIYNNIYFNKSNIMFNSQDSEYRIYAIPVKLFAKYTIAIDCPQELEMFCGLYTTSIDVSDKAIEFAFKTYEKVRNTLFRQPFIYDKLCVDNWKTKESDSDITVTDSGQLQINTNHFTRWDIANREKDLRLFIKVPATCKSTITILEGDYRHYNDCLYDGSGYKQNHSVLNFGTAKTGDEIDLNNYQFKPISKLQLLEFNTGESYPFADRLVEYLSGSAITPLDEISDNITRTQRVMSQNSNYFNIEGLWENKMQNILYDYIMSSGPIEAAKVCVDPTDKANYGKIVKKDYAGKAKQVFIDKRTGLHIKLGHANKSTLYDVLGYVDKDVEKWYSSWKIENDKAVVKDNIQNIDIYNGLYDI